MIKCVKCNEVDAIAKAGIVRGKQRYHCEHCDYYFTLPLVDAAAEKTPTRKHQTTIIDIARTLQVSKSTVSRALRGHADINPQTRQAILELAKELDYQPNLLAYGLAKNVSLTIGIIVPEFINSFFPYVIIGAQEIANPRGYHILICQSNESHAIEIENTKVLMASRVDGILASLTGETPDVEHFRKFEKAGIPVVYFNRVCDNVNASKVIVDDYEGAFKGVEHLIENGCSKIAHIAGPPNLMISKNRLQGYVNALKKHNLTVDESLIVRTNLTTKSATDCARHLFSMADRPDAVFCLNDPAAISAMLVAKELKIKIPDDVAFVGFSDEPAAALMEPGLTTLAQPTNEIGKTAIGLLFDQMNASRETFEHVTKILQTKLIVRKSSLHGVTKI
ncbi:substrate-binding domain-containing protein [Chryseolinea sp. H1M3-3]|uniref:LacI family DNA-binding transcriptional regulator n=1 Tax=Chryseolinea sp. H1M3-3 TaxID=3034144 RepID=UPI0023ED6385|nr:substrate-binding domain-containing protein [Chryseolinea sp. H1M3-3]